MLEATYLCGTHEIWHRNHRRIFQKLDIHEHIGDLLTASSKRTRISREMFQSLITLFSTCHAPHSLPRTEQPPASPSNVKARVDRRARHYSWNHLAQHFRTRSARAAIWGILGGGERHVAPTAVSRGARGAPPSAKTQPLQKCLWRSNAYYLY